MKRLLGQLGVTTLAYCVALASRLVTHSIVIVHFWTWVFTVAAAGLATAYAGHLLTLLVQDWRSRKHRGE